MCGRITLTVPDLVHLMEAFPGDWENQVEQPYRPRFNVAPGQTFPIVTEETGAIFLNDGYWGLIPRWAKDSKSSFINARAETVLEKPAFRKAFSTRRALVPADGYYEWKKEGKGKPPYWFSQPNRTPFFFAGIWEETSLFAPEKPKRTFSILTTAAADWMKPIHERMPVIVPADLYTRWLASDQVPPGDLLSLILRHPSPPMISHPVSSRVNSPRNDDRTLIEFGDTRMNPNSR